MLSLRAQVLAVPADRLIRASDFTAQVRANTVQQTLSRLCRDGLLVRVSHGVYRRKTENAFTARIPVFWPGGLEVG